MHITAGTSERRQLTKIVQEIVHVNQIPEMREMIEHTNGKGNGHDRDATNGNGHDRDQR